MNVQSAFMNIVKKAREHLQKADFNSSLENYQTASKLAQEEDFPLLYTFEVMPTLALLLERSRLNESAQQLWQEAEEAKREVNLTYGCGSEHTAARYTLDARESILESTRRSIKECEARLTNLPQSRAAITSEVSRNLSEQLGGIEQLLKAAEQQLKTASWPREALALDEKVCRLENQIKRYRDAIRNEQTVYDEKQITAELLKTKIGDYLTSHGFYPLNELGEIKDGDLIAHVIDADRAALLIAKDPAVEEAGCYYVRHEYWSYEDHEMKSDQRDEHAYSKVDVLGDCFFILASRELFPAKPKTRPFVFETYKLSFDKESGLYRYQLTFGSIDVMPNAWQVPFRYCLRHNAAHIGEVFPDIKVQETAKAAP